MQEQTNVSIQRTKPRWWTVRISGPSSESSIDELIRSYQEVLKSGVKRVCLDLTPTNPEFTLVHRRAPEVLQVAMSFQRVAVLVGDAKTAFAIKAATKVPEEGFRVFYDSVPLAQWLDEGN